MCSRVHVFASWHWLGRGIKIKPTLTALEARHQTLRVVSVMKVVERFAQQVFWFIAHQLEHSANQNKRRSVVYWGRWKHVLWTVDVAELHVEGVLGEEGARSQRNLDVWWMGQRSADDQQLAISVVFEDDVSGQVDHLEGKRREIEETAGNSIDLLYFVRGALDVDESTALGERALQTQHHVAVLKRIAVGCLRALGNLRSRCFAAIQRLTQLVMIAGVGVLPNLLTQQVDLKLKLTSIVLFAFLDFPPSRGPKYRRCFPRRRWFHLHRSTRAGNRPTPSERVSHPRQASIEFAFSRPSSLRRSPFAVRWANPSFRSRELKQEKTICEICSSGLGRKLSTNSHSSTMVRTFR
jgi:hypothetical protein